MTHPRFVAVALGLCLLPAGLFAQQQNQDDLGSLSLEELTQIRVGTASRHLENPRKAPAALTVIDKDEIRAFGWRTLADLLRAVPGFYTSYDRTYSYLGVRGFLQSGDYNARDLLMINGHRVNDNVYDSALIGHEFILDLSMIDRVEIIRGAGSSLYGNNAELAVINVITRRAEADPTLELSGSAQSHLGRSGEVKGSYRANGYEFLTEASLYHSNGPASEYYPEFDAPDTNNGIATNMDGERAEHVYLSLRHKRFTAEALFSNREKLVPDGSYGTLFNSRDSRSRDTRAYADLSYSHPLNDRTDLDLRLYYDSYNFWASFPYYDPDSNSNIVEVNKALNNWAGVEAVLSHKLGANRVVAGLNAEYNLRLWQKNFNLGSQTILNDHRNPSLVAAFAEFEFNPNRLFTINAGGRLDWHNTVGTSFSPRLVFMAFPSRATTLKATFNHAFRAPDAFDQNYEDVLFTGNTSLKPESENSESFLVEHTFNPHTSLQLNAFLNNLSSTLEESMDATTGNIHYTNDAGDRSYGLEAQLRAATRSGWKANASYTYAHATQKENNLRCFNSPQTLAKLHAIAPLSQANTLALELLYSSAQTGNGRQRVSSALLTNLNYNFAPRNTRWDVGLHMENIFDRRFRLPSGPEVMAAGSTQDGRTFAFRLNYHWSFTKNWD